MLVFGAGTDYALLLIARYREELRRYESKYVAMRRALRGAAPAVAPSGATVILGLLCLLLSDLSSNKSLGPVSALGIAATMVAMLTLLPALLALAGRRAFWPFVPRYGSASAETTGLWGTVPASSAGAPGIATVVLSFAATLGVCALVFEHGFGFAGEDASFPLYSFVFLVALGIDYNIFLMTRVREEALGLGTRPRRAQGAGGDRPG